MTAKIGVLESRHQQGADNLFDEVPAQAVMPVEEVFLTPFKTDAHFTCYEPVGVSDSSWPRINKPMLSKLRDQGGDLAMNLLVVDYDNPGHASWTGPEQVKALRARIDIAAQKFPLLANWSCFYTTKNGARLVYLLAEPLTPEDYEQHHFWFCEQLIKAGLSEVDLSISDWTRCFRAPFVVRAGKETWDEPWFVIEEQWGNCLLPSELGRSQRQKASEYAEIRAIEATQPDDAEAQKLLANEDGKTSEWYKQAKTRLKNRECFACIFNDELIARQGSRDSTIQAYVGQAVSLLFQIPDATPERVYALFLPAIRRLEPDRDTKDWTAVLWDKVCRLWAREDAKERRKQEIEEEKQEEAAEIGSRLATGFMEWCKDPSFVEERDPEAIRDYIQRRMIAQQGRTYFVMREDGYFDNHPLMPEQIIPYIRSKPIGQLIQTEIVGEDGSIRDIEKTSIINKHAYPVKAIEGIPQIKGGYITTDDRLVVQTYRRNPNLPAEYSEDVDLWLKELFGLHYRDGIKWLGYALAFEEGPICALSLKGAPGIGKKLLAHGLVECLENPQSAGPEDLVGDYQYGLLHSPFVVVDEGWPTKTAKHPADFFRTLVGGGGLNANQKYVAPIKTKNPARILFTANNLDVVSVLTGNRDLSPEDREALQIRLMHLNLDDKAMHWLRAKGGLRFTSGWIAGDGGRPSDFVVAKHFLYLHSIRKQLGRPGDRLLVQGDMRNVELMFAMRTQGGRSPLVVETIIKLLTHGMDRRGICVSDDRLYVLSSEILDFYRQTVGKHTKGESLSEKGIAQVLKNLVEEEKSSAIQLPEREELGRKRWHQIDIRLLHHAATESGWHCPKLIELVKKADEREGR